MIRQLRPDQLHEILPLIAEFRAEIPAANLFSDAWKDHFVPAWFALLSADIGAAFVAGDRPDGVLLASVVPGLLDGSTTATETIWFMSKAARGGKAGGALLDAFESWGRTRGATRFVLSHFSMGMPDLGPYFARRGYSPLETHYIKVVE